MEIPTRLFNAALMVAPQSVDEILSAKTAGIAPVDSDTPRESIVRLQVLADNSENEVVYAAEGYATIDGIALIEISGGLTYRAYSWWTTSYLDIRDSFRAAMADERVNSVLFLIDSPGGEVAGLFRFGR